MENLKEIIERDFFSALKKRDAFEISTLKLLKAEIFNKEKEKRYKISQEKPSLTLKELEKESILTDEEIITIIFSEIKKRKEAIEIFEKGRRLDLVEKEKKEIEILKNYLPEQLSEEEIKERAKTVIKKLGVKEAKDMGKVMRELMKDLKGKADGALISKLVKSLLLKK